MKGCIKKTKVAILGAGPAGLAAAWQLVRTRKANVVVFEQRDDVGGNAGSFEIDGLPVDYGSHRLHPACQPNILNDLRNLLKEDLLVRKRHGRIYLRGRWIHFPLRPDDLLLHLPWSFGLGVAKDTFYKIFQKNHNNQKDTYASILERNLGKTICHNFYFPYAIKLWGISPNELSKIQAHRRISANSISKMLYKVIGIVPVLKSPLTGCFYYPRKGFGQINSSIAQKARELGAEIQTNTSIRKIYLGTPHRIEVESKGVIRAIEADYVWSTIPLTILPKIVYPPAPTHVQESSNSINHRAIILIYLVLAQPQFTPFDAHYFPEKNIKLSRFSESKNYSGRAEPKDRTILCGELPCTVDDSIWQSSDSDLANIMCNSLTSCGLPIQSPILKIIIKRLPFAYPIYHNGYEDYFAILDEWATGLDRILTFGRQGLFAHDNTHHALAMGYAAVDCLQVSGKFDVERWNSYRKEFENHVVED